MLSNVWCLKIKIKKIKQNKNKMKSLNCLKDNKLSVTTYELSLGSPITDKKHCP